MTDIRVTPQRWLWQPRQKPIRMIEIHATRGNTTPAKQKGAALNWVQSANNGSAAQGWGSSFSHVIGTDGSQGTVLDDNRMPTYSAGYGGAGSTYAIDEYAISYELAQSPAQEPFSDAIYDRLTTEVAIDCKKYGIPPVMIEIPRQTGAVPTGIVRHDKCENGTKLGKTDPGNQFDEARFIAQLKAKMAPPAPPPEPEPEPEEDDMAKLIKREGTGTVYVTDGVWKWAIPSSTVLRELQAAGLVSGGIKTVSRTLFDRLKTTHGQPAAGGGSGLTFDQTKKAVKDAGKEGTG